MIKTPFLRASAVAAGLVVAGMAAHAAPPQLEAAPARAREAGAATQFDGVVEAVRQTVVAAQVSGAVVQLGVKAGDVVKAGQVLLRIDARAAEQNVLAGDAQVLVARAALDVASKQFERQQQLYQKNYISQGAMERAEAEFKATRAQLAAQGAQANAVRTESGFYAIRAPYAGVVAELPVSMGDMAMPGRPLLTMYDPSALRISVPVPQSFAAQALPGQLPKVELPGLPAASRWVVPVRAELLPTVDAATHTVLMRLDLPGGLAGVSPGMFARVWLQGAGGTGAVPAANVAIPLRAVIRRAELTGVYVLSADGKPQLRQVRLGRVDGDQVEVLSGLMPGERVATEPQAAARIR